MLAGMGHRRKRACGEGVGTTKGTMLGRGCGRGLPSLCSTAWAGSGRAHGAVSAWRVWWSAAACRSVRGNNLGGKLPAQYSALTNLQVLCVAPDPAFAPIRSDPGGGCALRLSRCAQRSSPASLRGLRA